MNLKSGPGLAYCCDRIDDKVYISVPRQDATQRDFKREWFYLSTTLALYAHERRHADAGAPGHTTGCESTGCDGTYDLDNLGAYGVQYWLQSSWATGYLNIGIGCLPQTDAEYYAERHATAAYYYRRRFVTNIPPIVHVVEPYGGECPILTPQGR